MDWETHRRTESMVAQTTSEQETSGSTAMGAKLDKNSAGMGSLEGTTMIGVGQCVEAAGAVRT